MKQYTVTGMSCAACSTRVEKAVSKVPGVTSCSVSLLTNSMGVEGSATDQEIIKAVADAGYGASAKDAEGEKNGGANSAAASEEALADHEHLLVYLFAYAAIETQDSFFDIHLAGCIWNVCSILVGQIGRASCRERV